MNIDTIVLGDYQANCYCIRENADQKDCLLIDPGLNPEPLIRFLQANDYKAVSIVLTHGHVDHIGGVESLREYWPQVQVAIHEKDVDMLTNPAANLSVMSGTMVQTRPAEKCLGDSEQFYTAVGFRFQVLHTPGHTPGGICLYSAKEKVLFAGDTLFAGSVGRSDFPGGSHKLLIKMIKERLLILPEQTKVYPGHGPETTILEEKKFNPFLK